MACEPSQVEDMGLELSDVVADAVGRAADLVVETCVELQSGAAYADNSAPAGSG